LSVISICFVFAAHSTTLDSPAIAEYTNDDTPDFKFTVIGTNDTYDAELVVDGVRHGTLNVANNSLSTITANKSLSEGLRHWYINATNGSSINQSQTWNITVDTTNPLVIFGVGTDANGTYANKDAVYVNVSVTETNPSNITFTLHNSTELVNTTFYSMNDQNSNITINWTSLPDSTYYYNVTVVDLATNKNITKTRVLTLDSTYPLIDFETPSTATGNYSQNWIFANISASDNNLGTITINLYNTSGLVNSSIRTTSPFFLNFTGLSDGLYFINASVNDSVGFENFTATRNITLDTTFPDVDIIAPANTTYNNATQMVNISSDGYAIWFYNTTNNETYSSEVDRTFSEGTNTITAWANDTVGNTNSTSVTFTIDTTYPLIDYGTGTLADRVNVSQSNVYVNVSVTETNPVNITFVLHNSSAEVNRTTYSMVDANSNVTINWTALPDDTYTYNVTTTDVVNNVNNTATRTLTLDTTYPLIDFGVGTDANGTYANKDAIYVNVSVTETNEANITFKLYNSSALVNSSTFTDGTRNINWTSLPDDTYYYNITSTDSANNINNTATRILILDNTYPLIDIGVGTLADNAFSQADSVYMNVSVTEANEANITFKLYNSTSLENSSTFTDGTRNINWTSLSDGTYYYNATITDSANQINNTATRTVTLDTTNPLMSFAATTPADNSNLSQSNIAVEVSVTEGNPVNITYVLHNDSAELNVTTYSMASQTSNTSINWQSLPDGTYTYNVTITDQANRQNISTTRTVNLETVAPNVTLLSPADSATDTDGNVTFTYNVTDTNIVSNCSLFLAGSLNQTNTSIDKTSNTINFTVTNIAQSDTLSWYVSCRDNYNNNGNSSTYTLDTYDNPATTNATSSSSSSSGGGSPASTYDAGELDTSGYTKTIDKSDRIEFTIDDETYKLKLSFVNDGAETVTIYLYETAENIELNESEKTPIDLDGDGEYDIYLTCDEVVDHNSAKLSVDLYGIVEETVEEPEEEEEEVVEEVVEEEPVVEQVIEEEPGYKTWWILTIIGVGAAIIIGTGLFLLLRKKQ